MKLSGSLKFKNFISNPLKAILHPQMALFFFLLFSGFFISGPASGQFQSGGRSLVQTGSIWTGPSGLKSSDDQFSQFRQSLQLGLPVWQKFKKKDSGMHCFQIGIQSSNQLEINNLSPISGAFNSVQAGLGMNGFWLDGNKNLLFTRLSMGYFGDAGEPASYLMRPTGNLIYGKKLGSKWTFLGGFSYNFLFGSGFALPILGFSFTPVPKTRLLVLLPLSIRFMWWHNQNFQSQMGLRPVGGISVFGSAAFRSDNSSQTLILRNRAFSLFYNLMYMPARNWRIGLGMGLLAKRKIWVSEGSPGSFSSENNLLADNLKNGWQIQVSMAYRFSGKRKKRENSSGQNTEIELSDEDLKDLNPGDDGLFFDNFELP